MGSCIKFASDLSESMLLGRLRAGIVLTLDKFKSICVDGIRGELIGGSIDKKLMI